MKAPLAAAAALVVALGSGPLAADPTPEQTEGWEAFPAELVDRPYIADPHQPRFGVSLVSAREAEIDSTGDERFGLWLGGRFGLLEFTPRRRPDSPWQLAIEAGFYGLFDIDSNQDNVGWDGIYGLVLTKRLGPRTAIKLAAKHLSSHVGDELQERTGRQRINYTREELILGASRRFGAAWRLYGEGAWGYESRNPELQEPGRFQVGLEYRAPRPSFWRAHWYMAVDATSFEESEWELDVTVQTGFEIPTDVRSWRFGLAYYDGRVPIGEFFQDRERYVVLGLWLDP
ncbi:MAG: DUF1207 domain-containing protein [Thermoanaerobaculia bacterium]|nr:DUF1207 domain-containing protein [Thermoanaerobaculia bacterium]